jgi:hypothetical protein
VTENSFQQNRSHFSATDHPDFLIFQHAFDFPPYVPFTAYPAWQSVPSRHPGLGQEHRRTSTGVADSQSQPTPQALQRPVGVHSRGRFPARSTMAYFPEAVNLEIASMQENVSFAL